MTETPEYPNPYYDPQARRENLERLSLGLGIPFTTARPQTCAGCKVDAMTLAACVPSGGVCPACAEELYLMNRPPGAGITFDNPR